MSQTTHATASDRVTWFGRLFGPSRRLVVSLGRPVTCRFESLECGSPTDSGPQILYLLPERPVGVK